MQHMLTVNVLIAMAFLTSLTTQTATHDVTTLVRTEVERVQGTDTQTRDESIETRRQELEAKRLEIDQKTAQKKAAITDKLSGKRAEQCLAKQDQINRMLDDRSEAALRHYETFTAIQAKLDAYVAEQGIEVPYNSARQIIMPESQDRARAEVEALLALDFDCSNADANAPGAIIKDQIAEAKQALADYRSAIKDYAEAVRSAATEETGPTEAPVEEEPTNE